MILSQNGYSADYTATTSIRVPGGALRVRGGSVAVVFTHLAQRFNDDVEALVWPGCWGYADRNIRGSATAVSNHASGTAVDFNAPRHPLGVVGTFTTGQRAAIERILADFAPVIRWGGHYSGRKDEMHFEINAPQVAVDALAARLTAPPSQAGSGLPTNSTPPDPQEWDDMATKEDLAAVVAEQIAAACRDGGAIEGRMDEHDKWVTDRVNSQVRAHRDWALANLKATVGREITAQAAQLAALSTAVESAGHVDMAAVTAAAQKAAEGAVATLAQRLADATNPDTADQQGA